MVMDEYQWLGADKSAATGETDAPTTRPVRESPVVHRDFVVLCGTHKVCQRQQGNPNLGTWVCDLLEEADTGRMHASCRHVSWQVGCQTEAYLLPSGPEQSSTQSETQSETTT